MAEKKKKDGATLRERISVALDIPSDVFPRSTYVEIRGRESVTVCGGRTIDLYTDSEVRIGTADGVVILRGKRLCCRAFRRGRVTVTGRIDSVEFAKSEEIGKEDKG